VNRSDRRSVLHDVRKLGCTCNPTISDAPREGWPTGAVAGAYIVHEANSGCPLGARAFAANQAGIVPSLIVNETKCGR